MHIEQLITNNDGTIIDVRTPREFMGGHVAGSINIPVVELPYRMKDLKELSPPLLFCCASGNRSGHAAQFCTNQGLESYNAGAWTTVNYYKSLASQL
ncbi:MAG: rhodanese-like domain-containing protein [Saprospiraceae bacterium]|jgi:rhodanese-related sulfurtransferase|nr:rhodanese-like domain-containing protein [Saprospiraceae bacterium]MBL0023839.1 rhodanese-like domain-containing protein [Saprospiraceae bacterium]